jgi:transcriptional regulator with XRE-family HTH domain
MNKFTPADQKKIELAMELRAKLWQRGLTQKRVAEKIKKSKALICQVLSGITTSKPAVESILSLIHKTPIDPRRR